ncbi:DUF5615 family PIN-like protein [Hymenobacter terrestris]|uniref:DUF5615 family PIN-like protein n=1 Tax=Hymenobacter terrestris TaxID=2748310 RepID=A0ABX2Q4Z8_9BACT|nr:DUF5615 family PIN-like protein [Hymenobacter terrestris]NVO86029.1 DUF5615 family PIN-like protein [Hymenobacter terrestris]
MKWLLDANLSYRLVRQLASTPAEIVHVSRSGLAAPASDEEIWEWARVNGALIITNDEDFYRLAAIYQFPPKVVLLRTVNQSTAFIAELLTRHLDEIIALNTAGEIGILELY